MKDNEYKCASCGEIFEKGWSDEESMEETKKNFGDVPENELEVICDDCYKKITVEIPISDFKEVVSFFKEHQQEFANAAGVPVQMLNFPSS
jgi:DNA-directed RNA polymerase subunit RPC12/RpoP